MPAELIDGIVQALLAPTLFLKFLARSQPPQVLDQQRPVDQEGAASLVAAEGVKQFDRSTAPQSEQALDDGPIRPSASGTPKICARLARNGRSNPWRLWFSMTSRSTDFTLGDQVSNQRSLTGIPVGRHLQGVCCTRWVPHRDHENPERGFGIRHTLARPSRSAQTETIPGVESQPQTHSSSRRDTITKSHCAIIMPVWERLRPTRTQCDGPRATNFVSRWNRSSCSAMPDKCAALPGSATLQSSASSPCRPLPSARPGWEEFPLRHGRRGRFGLP